MEPNRPWLCQGDLFAEVPICEVSLDSLVGVRYRTRGNGTALLITDDCQLDKRTSKAQKPKVSRLQFVPVRDLVEQQLGHDLERRLRAGEVQPPEVVYLPLSDGLEGVALLGEAYHIPASYFSLEVVDFSGQAGADPEDPFHVCPTRHDSRALTLSNDERRLLQEKMAWYWTHMKLPPSTR